jgi:hypothetical protein
VTTELTTRVAFQAHSTEKDIVEVILITARIVWELEENRHFDVTDTLDNERVLQFARAAAKAAFQNHPNFAMWLD